MAQAEERLDKLKKELFTGMDKAYDLKEHFLNTLVKRKSIEAYNLPKIEFK